MIDRYSTTIYARSHPPTQCSTQISILTRSEINITLSPLFGNTYPKISCFIHLISANLPFQTMYRLGCWLFPYLPRDVSFLPKLKGRLGVTTFHLKKGKINGSASNLHLPRQAFFVRVDFWGAKTQ